MNNIRYIATMMMSIVMLALTSCNDIPTDMTLDAQWQLMTITKADGSTEVPDNRSYWCFYRHTAQVNTLNVGVATANLDYVKEQTLTLTFPDYTVAQLAQYYLPTPQGVDGSTRGYAYTFGVEKISSSTLVLVYDDATYRFRRY